MSAAPMLTQALVLLVLLQIKHLIADFLFQTPRMLVGKGRYGDIGGVAHAGLHAGLSLLVLVLCGVPPSLALVVALAELLVHYHIDWSKEQLTARYSRGPQERSFWGLIGLDQLAHQLTYLAMIAWVFL